MYTRASVCIQGSDGGALIGGSFPIEEKAEASIARARARLPLKRSLSFFFARSFFFLLFFSCFSRGVIRHRGNHSSFFLSIGVWTWVRE